MDGDNQALQKWGMGVVAPVGFTAWALWVLVHGTVTIAGRRGSVLIVLTGWEAAVFAVGLVFAALHFFFEHFAQRSEGLERYASVGEAIALVGGIGCLVAVLVAVVPRLTF